MTAPKLPIKAWLVSASWKILRIKIISAISQAPSNSAKKSWGTPTWVSRTCKPGVWLTSTARSKKTMTTKSTTLNLKRSCLTTPKNNASTAQNSSRKWGKSQSPNQSLTSVMTSTGTCAKLWLTAVQPKLRRPIWQNISKGGSTLFSIWNISCFADGPTIICPVSRKKIWELKPPSFTENLSTIWSKLSTGRSASTKRTTTIKQSQSCVQGPSQRSQVAALSTSKNSIWSLSLWSEKTILKSTSAASHTKTNSTKPWTSSSLALSGCQCSTSRPSTKELWLVSTIKSRRALTASGNLFRQSEIVARRRTSWPAI